MARATRAQDRRGMRWFGAALLASVLAPAAAQYLQIPDFRHEVPAATRPAGPCDSCGVIRAIRESQSQRPAAVPQAFQNPQGGGGESTMRIGAVVALPMGDSPNDEAFVGGVGTPEMRARFSETSYEITVLLDNGAYSVLQRRDGGRFRVGDRVKVRGIELELVPR